MVSRIPPVFIFTSRPHTIKAVGPGLNTYIMENTPLPEHAAGSQILFYQSEDGTGRIEVRIDEGTVWLTQALIAELYQTTKQHVSLPIRNIPEDGELAEGSVVKEYLTTAG
jgi:hypothetical protein